LPALAAVGERIDSEVNGASTTNADEMKMAITATTATCRRWRAEVEVLMVPTVSGW
jgi:hypothetical protein